MGQEKKKEREKSKIGLLGKEGSEGGKRERNPGKWKLPWQCLFPARLCRGEMQ